MITKSHTDNTPKKVLILGGGFVGINAAKALGNRPAVDVTLIDRKNHHLFQPLLYQVAMAGLSPAEIAAPIRSTLSMYRNIRVLMGEVIDVNLSQQKVITDFAHLDFDFLIMALGAEHTYFGHNQWEEYAPGLKTVTQATEIRRRVLTAFELAEREPDPQIRKKLMTFVIVGGGPTGVELAGAIGEMSRHTLARDFRAIDPTLTRVIIIEASPHILSMFSPELASRAMRDLETLGVQVWTSSKVTDIDVNGVEIGSERIAAATVLWAAGVQAPEIGKRMGVPIDAQGRIIVEPDLRLKDFSQVFIAGDQAHFTHQTGKPLPGLASVALQQGHYIGKTILKMLANKPHDNFHYRDKGKLATIGKSRAIAETGTFKFTGLIAWLMWLLVHIYYLNGFKNRLMVFIQWVWSYVTYDKGARLIVRREWRSYPPALPHEE